MDIENQVFLAQNLLERGQTLKAISILEKLQLNTSKAEDIDGLVLLAECLNKIDRDDEATELVEELLKNNPDDWQVTNVALQIFSCFKNKAKEAEKIALEQKSKYPDHHYYHYILSYLGFHWLNYPKEKVLGLLENSLRLSNHSEYLDHAYEIYDSYRMNERRDHYLALMVKDSPDSYETRKLLIQKKLYSKEYEEFALLAIELLKDFPKEDWVVEKIDEVKDVLYGDDMDRYLQKISFFFDELVERTNNQFLAYAYFFSMCASFLIGLIFFFFHAPIWLVKKFIVDYPNHFRLLDTDSLYRTLNKASDITQEQENGLLLFLTHEDNSKKIIFLKEDKMILAKKLNCSLNQLKNEELLDCFEKPIENKFDKIFKISINEVMIEVNFSENDYLVEDFYFLSPEVPLILKEHLKKKQWELISTKKTSVFQVLFWSLIYILVSGGIFYSELSSNDAWIVTQIFCFSIFISSFVKILCQFPQNRIAFVVNSLGILHKKNELP